MQQEDSSTNLLVGLPEYRPSFYCKNCNLFMVNACLDTSSTSLNMYVKTGTNTVGWFKELWFVLIYIKGAPKQK